VGGQLEEAVEGLQVGRHLGEDVRKPGVLLDRLKVVEACAVRGGVDRVGRFNFVHLETFALAPNPKNDSTRTHPSHEEIAQGLWRGG
jgi:hypothetical protein